jgi:stage V sporulation protein G
MAISVSDVKVRIIDRSKNSKIVAFADIILNEGFCVKNCRVIDGSKGIFVVMPSIKNNKTGDFDDVCYPITKEGRKEIETKILDEYYKQSKDSVKDDTIDI